MGNLTMNFRRTIVVLILGNWRPASTERRKNTAPDYLAPLASLECECNAPDCLRRLAAPGYSTLERVLIGGV